MEPHRPPPGCVLVLKKPLDRWLPVLLMSSVSVHEHEREDIFPSLGNFVTVDPVWTLPDPVSFRGDSKWQTWTGVEHIAL